MPYEPNEPVGKTIAGLFEAVAEDHLTQPTIIYEFPTAVSPLSKQKPDESEWTERFEIFAGQMEISNGFSELNDPEDQRRRFEAQLKERERGDEEAHQMDEDYIRALSYGMPPADWMFRTRPPIAHLLTPRARKRRVGQNRADSDSHGNAPSECVDEVELLTLKRWLWLRSRAGSGLNCAHVVFQPVIQHASEPHGVLSQHILLRPPCTVDAVLQNVSGSALIALAERRDDRILLDAPPGITKLHVVL